MSLDEFHTTIDRLARTSGSWGFIVVRTAAASDDSQWTRAYGTLRDFALRSIKLDYDAGHGRQNARPRPYTDSSLKSPELFNLPVLDLQTAQADEKSLDDLRDLVNQQIEQSRQRDQSLPQEERGIEDVDDEKKDEDSQLWLSKLHLDGYLVVDDEAMTELLAASSTISTTDLSHDDLQPTVVFLDAVDSCNVSYQGGSPFTGWMRVEVQSLSVLELDLELHGRDAGQRSRRIYPQRQWHGQVPVYRGQRGARFIDARLDKAADKYMFPRGTPRGWQGTVATWESIPEEYRGRQRLATPPAWFVRQQQQERDEAMKARLDDTK